MGSKGKSGTVGAGGPWIGRAGLAAPGSSDDRLADFISLGGGDWLWETDAALRFSYVSPRPGHDDRAPDLIGRTRWEVAGADPDADAAWGRHRSDLLARRLFRQFEYSYRGRDGLPVWASISGKPLFDGGGGFLGYRGTATDITERKSAERALRESEARLRDMVLTASDWFWETDGDHRFTLRVGRAPVHRGSDRVIGRTPWELWGPEEPEADPAWAAHLVALRAHEEFINHVLPVRDPTDHVGFVAVSGRPRHDSTGRFLGHRGTSRNVTVATRAANELAARVDQLELAGELARIGHYRVDPVRGVYEISAGVHRIMGRDPATAPLTLKRRFEGYHPDDRARVADAIASAMARREGYDLSARVARPDGAVRHVVMRGRPERPDDAAATAYIGVMVDVTAEVEQARALAAEARENAIYRAAIEAMPDLVYCKDAEGRFLAANMPTAAQMGAASAGDLLGRSDFDFYPKEIATLFWTAEMAVIASGEARLFEEPMYRTDGTVGVQMSLKAPLRDRAGMIMGLVGHSRDVTREREAEVERARLAAELVTQRQDAAAARDRLAAAAAVVDGGFALFDPDDRLVVCNEAYAEFYGARPVELLGRTFRDMLSTPSFRGRLNLGDESFGHWLDRRIDAHRHATGEPFEVHLASNWLLTRDVRTADGSTVVYRMDITHLKRIERELRILADNDPLTGIANRRSFVAAASRSLEHALRDNDEHAVILMDVDQFKQVNDRFGHAAGDAVLRDLAQRCAALLRPADLFGRWGGEEFIFLCRAEGLSPALLLAERLRAAITSMPVTAGTHAIAVTASFGVAMAGACGFVLDPLISAADEGLYAAKAAGRDRVEPAPHPAGSAPAGMPRARRKPRP